MRRLLPASIAAVLVLSAASARAEVLPTFSPEVLARRATHVIVASEGESLDGQVEVVESWRGDLRPGERVKVEGLRAFEESDESTLFDWRGSGMVRSTPGPRAAFRRCVLYLVRSASDPKAFAASAHDIASCVVCIEGPRLYAMQQEVNPGPRRLIQLAAPYPGTEADLRAAVIRYDDLARQLAEVLREDRLRDRAEALEPLCRDFDIGSAATNALVACGQDGLPVLWRLYRAEPGHSHRYAWMRGIVAVGGAGEAPKIATLLHEETSYWKEAAPALADASWKAPLLQRYDMLEQMLGALGALGAPAGRDDAQTLLSLADAHPRFARDAQSSGLRRAARHYLEATKAPPPTAK